MLKSLILNKRKIPVPIPIQNLEEAVSWVEQALLSKEQAITKIELDGREVEALNNSRQVPLSGTSRLVVQSDSPLDLALQTVDALRNMLAVIDRGLKPLAVLCWQTLPKHAPEGLGETLSDIDLLLDLLDHVVVLLHERPGAKILEACAEPIIQCRKSLAAAVSQSDWKGAARVLLNQLAEKLEKLNGELGTVQKDLFDWQCNNRNS